MLNSRLINFKEVNDDLNVPRVGGKCLLPDNVEWAVNPSGEKMILLLSLPTNFLNEHFQFNYPSDNVVSVFSTYNKEDYFLELISYQGGTNGLKNIKDGFTKVILHPIGTPRNESDFLVPAMEVIVGDEFDVPELFCGNMLGGTPSFLQNEITELNSYKFCMQLYGGDLPEEFEDVFCLSDAVGYLFLRGNEKDPGLFFVQFT